MIKTIVINNLIAIAIHVLICLILLIPIGYTLRIGFVNEIITDLVTCFCIIIMLVLYYRAGRMYLIATENILSNVFSVVSIIILLILIVPLLNKNTNTEPYFEVLATPIAPIVELLFEIFHLKKMHIYWGVLFIPSFSMWVGMMCKK